MSAASIDPPVEALFPTSVERNRLTALLATELHEIDEAMRAGRVTPDYDPKRLAAELCRFNFSSPIDLADMLPWLTQLMREGLVQMTHPRYFGLFNPAPGFPSIIASEIVAAFNPQLAAYKTSPAAVAIETHVIKQVALRAGLPMVTTGHFTNSGSDANFTALTCALTSVCPAFRSSGARAFRTPPAIYISREAHQGWFKIAHQAGIGRLAIRLIDTDGAGRMSVKALADAVRADTANGAVPVMIVATAGTTVAGMVDPLLACAEMADHAGAWFHVDAAWGGGVIASDYHRAALAGIELADSVTIDAHKWFSTTMGCGMFFVTRPWILKETFDVSASFMPASQGAQDPYTSSLLWSRRFLGLQLFLSLAAAGWDGYARHIERTVSLCEDLHTQLAARGWSIVNPGGLGVLCVIPPPPHRPVHQIVESIVASGEAWVAAANFEGRDVIRICISNGRTEENDIAALIELLQRHALSAELGDHIPESQIASRYLQQPQEGPAQHG